MECVRPSIRFWDPWKMWNGKTLYIIGGGPSLYEFDFTLLRHKHVLVINEAYRDVQDAHVLFFRDYEWYVRTKPSFQGLRITVWPKPWQDENVYTVEVGTKDIPYARTSGHYACSLGMVMGARRIILLGYDHNEDGGNYHNRHPTRGLLYHDQLISTWNDYRQRADNRGITILNATPRSRIEAFDRVDIRYVL